MGRSSLLQVCKLHVHSTLIGAGQGFALKLSYTTIENPLKGGILPKDFVTDCVSAENIQKTGTFGHRMRPHLFSPLLISRPYGQLRCGSKDLERLKP